MKEQMNTITAWREHMITAKDQQQQSLLKAQEKISALERENAKLSECLNKTANTNKEGKAAFCMKVSYGFI